MFEWLCNSEYSELVISRKLEPKDLTSIATEAAVSFWRKQQKSFEKIVIEISDKKYICELIFDPLWDAEELI